MGSIQLDWAPADGREITFQFPTGPIENYEAKITVLVEQKESGDPKYPRTYRPAQTIRFQCSLDDLRDLVRSLERLT